MVFDVNWQSKFNYPLDWNRPMAEVWGLMIIKNQQIKEANARRK